MRLRSKSSRTSNRIRIELEIGIVRIAILNFYPNRIEILPDSIRFDSCGAVASATVAIGFVPHGYVQDYYRHRPPAGFAFVF
jgi:hypothetical protein